MFCKNNRGSSLIGVLIILYDGIFTSETTVHMKKAKNF
jgi:hypothetical protein